MKKTFFKNLFRDVKKSISRFLSIIIIIAVGVAFYAGVRATSPDMKISGDAYFDKNNLMDFKLISTLGLTKDDVAEVEKISGVTQVQGAYSIDAVTEKDKRELVLNINSQPEDNGINSVTIVRGKKAESADEAVVEEKFLAENKLNLGDTITLKSGDDSNMGDSLKNIEFKIVGTAQSPLYVSAQRQLSSVGNGSVKGFVYILPEVFKNDVYTEIYVRTEGNESKTSLINNDAYNSYVAGIKDALVGLGDVRKDIRYAEVLKSATDKIDEAQAKLDSSRKEAEEKFADAHKQIDDAKAKLAKGKVDLQNNQTLFNQQIAEGEKQIADGKSQIQSGEEQISANNTISKVM